MQSNLQDCQEISTFGSRFSKSNPLLGQKFYISFVELGGGVDDVLVWRCDGAYVEFGFQ